MISFSVGDRGPPFGKGSGRADCTKNERGQNAFRNRQGNFGPGDDQKHRSSAVSGRYPHPHMLCPENRVSQVGFAGLLCALVAMERAEELLWRVARVRWAVVDPSGPW